MIKCTDICELNNDQIKTIKEKGWCFFTECDEGGSYYNRGYNIVNRIGYVVCSEWVEQDYFESYESFTKTMEYDDGFGALVRETLEPLEDKCYVFLIKNPAHYTFEQVWTNKGLEKAKEIAKLRYGKYKPQYFDGKDHYEKMDKIITSHNEKVRKCTNEATKLLEENGFEIISDGFKVRKKRKGRK